MDQVQVINEVRSYIIENIMIGAPADSLLPDDSFLQKGILDSTGILEVIGFLERRYGITCADDEITPENLDSLKFIARFVQNKLSGFSAGTESLCPGTEGSGPHHAEENS